MRKGVGWFLLPVLGVGGLAVILLARSRAIAPEAPPTAAPEHRSPEPPPGEAIPEPPSIATRSREGSPNKAIEVQLGEALARLDLAIKARSVWKEEIQILLELEDLAFRSAGASRAREFLLKTLADPATGRDLCGLIAFVLSASPTDPGRRDLAGLLGKKSGADASIVYALTIRNGRIDQDRSGREAFWKGCLSFAEREDLLSLGFRERLFQEDYGHSLEEVRRREVVKPSAADRFDAQVIQPFHALRKQGFSTYLTEGDAVRGLLVEYLQKGDSPEAKLAVCILLKPGPDLALGAREAFPNSASYPETVRRWLLGRAQGEDSRSGWEVLYDPLPYAGNLKNEVLGRMVTAAGEAPERQARTLELLRREIARTGQPEERLGDFVKGVAGLRSEEAENYLFQLCRTPPDESLRATAAIALCSGDREKMDLGRYQRRIDCAEEALLKDPSPQVRSSAACALAELLSSRGKVSNAAQVEAQVEALVVQGQLTESLAQYLRESLGRER